MVCCVDPAYHTRSFTKTIILIDISAENYSFTELYQTITLRVSMDRCPCCGTVGQFRRHAWYEKHHYQKRIRIARVQCGECGSTHAVIPSFSLPGTSVGTEEVERYLADRHNGKSRGKAAGVFAGLGLHESYPKHLEKMFATAVSRGKALFPEGGEVSAVGYTWVHSLLEEGTRRVIWELNMLCSASGYNPVFFSRSSILLLENRKSGIRISHNNGPVRTRNVPIDSS